MKTFHYYKMYQSGVSMEIEKLYSTVLHNVFSTLIWKETVFFQTNSLWPSESKRIHFQWETDWMYL